MSQKYLFYPARIDSWKRQDFAIDVLQLIHEQGHIVYLYLPGHISNQQYYQKLLEKIKDCHLEDYVVFLGPIDKNKMLSYEKYALGNLLFYDYSNLGNCFLEAFSIGGVIIGRNDGTLNPFLTHNSNGFLINNENEAVEIINNLINDREMAKRISLKAKEDAAVHLKPWDDRVENEVSLIEQYT